MSGSPQLVNDAEQNQGQTAPNQQDLFGAIVANDRHVVLDVWITIEKLMAPSPDERAGEGEDEHGRAERYT
jgi:hypothetical protein